MPWRQGPSGHRSSPRLFRAKKWRPLGLRCPWDAPASLMKSRLAMSFSRARTRPTSQGRCSILMAARSSTAKALAKPFVAALAEEAGKAGLRYTSDAKPGIRRRAHGNSCLLYTSDAADERSSVDLGGRRIIKKKKQ